MRSPKRQTSAWFVLCAFVGLAALGGWIESVWADEPHPLPSSWFGTVALESGDALPPGTALSAWIGGERFAETTVAADASFRLDIPGDRLDTSVVEGGLAGQAVELRVDEFVVSQSAPASVLWQEGRYLPLDVVAPPEVLSAAPDLVVTVDDGRAEALPGDLLQYQLTLRNDGTRRATGTLLTATLPDGITFLTASDDGALDPTTGTASGAVGTVTWPAFELAAGTAVTRTVEVRVDTAPPSDLAQLLFSASATSTGGRDLEPADNSATDVTTLAQLANLTVEAVVPPTADAQSLTVTGSGLVTVANTGAATVSASTAFEVTVFEDLDGDRALSAADTVLGAATFPAELAAGATSDLSVPLSGTLSFLDAPLWAWVDSRDTVAELDEDDNLARSATGCRVAPPVGVFEPVVEWSWPPLDDNGQPAIEEPLSKESVATPIVVQLTDDNGDGRFDGEDTPDIVFVTANLGNLLDPRVRLRAISGADGSALWTVVPPVSQFVIFSLSGLAAGDLDGDGTTEIIVSGFFDGRPNRLVAYDNQGRRRWISEGYSTHPDGTTLTNRDNPTLADLDGDGQPEILVGAHVFDGLGRLRWSGSGGQAYQSASNRDGVDSGAISIAADLDLDGTAEVVTGTTAYRADGSVYWQLDETHADGYPAVANFDGDDYPEIVVVARGQLRLHEHDGTLIWGPVDLPGAGDEAGGAPTIADFDGDGAPEIGVAGSTQYAVFEGDGSVKWQRSVRDGSSNMTGSTVFDLDGDGRFEVLYRDEAHLRIFRGSDGTVLFEDAFSSITQNEQVVVADVDGDGGAEVLVTSDLATQLDGLPERSYGLRVYGDATGNWRPARKVWNQHAFHADNVRDDGSVPATAPHPWLTHNTFRANVAPVGVDPLAAADLSASYLRVDFDAWPQIAVTVRVGNGGTSAAPAGVPVHAYDGDPATGGALLGVAATSQALVPGRFEDVALTFDATSLGAGGEIWGAREVVVQVDPEDALRECNESNNEHRFAYDTTDVGLAVQLVDGVERMHPGDSLTVTATVVNAGPGARTGVTLRVDIPAGTSSLDTLEWQLGDLGAGTSSDITFIVDVDAGLPAGVTELTMIATVTDDGSAGPDPTPANNQASDTNVIASARADAGGPYSGTEGAPVQLDGSASTDRDGTLVAYAWDLDGDGIFDDASIVAPTWIFADNGVFTVALQVIDDSGEVDIASTQVTVANAAPVLDPLVLSAPAEGEALHLDVAYSDAGSDDSHSATVDWGDGVVEPATVDAAASVVRASHAYGQDGSYTVRLCLRDDDGGESCRSQTLGVVNAAPVVSASTEGADLRLWTAESWAYDQRSPDWQVAPSGTQVEQLNDSQATVFLSPYLATGLTLEFTVRPIPFWDYDWFGFVLGYRPGDAANPEADFLLVDWKRSGAQISANPECGSGYAEGGLAVSRVRGVPLISELAAHVDLQCNGLSNGVTEISRSHDAWGYSPWNNGWEYRFRVESRADRVQIWMNGNPIADLSGDYAFGSGRFGFYTLNLGLVQFYDVRVEGLAVLEGSTFPLGAAFVDPGSADSHSATVDWGDGNTTAAGLDSWVANGQTFGRIHASYSYPDDGEFVAQVCVDDGTDTGCGDFPLTVINAEPQIDAGPDRPAYVGGFLELDASYWDAGPADTHTATVDWGDGTIESVAVTPTASAEGSAGRIVAQHAYDLETDYPVRVCVTDDDGGEACDSFLVYWRGPLLDFGLSGDVQPSSLRPGESVPLTLSLTNHGTLEPTNVELLAVVPPPLEIGAIEPAPSSFDATTGTLVWSLDHLAYRAQLDITVEVRAPNTTTPGDGVLVQLEVWDDGSQGVDTTPDDHVVELPVEFIDPQAPRVSIQPGSVDEGSPYALQASLDQPGLSPLDNGRLLAYLPLDGDVQDASGNENHGSIWGTPTPTEGYRGGAYEFGGFYDGDSIEIPVDINVTAQPKLTMGAWVKTVPGFSYVINTVISHDSGGFDRTLVVDYRSGDFGWSIFQGSESVLGVVPIRHGEWTFVAAVYEQIGPIQDGVALQSVRLYVDGQELVGQGYVGPGFDRTWLGVNPEYYEPWIGSIDEAFIIGEVLEACDLEALRISGPQLPPRSYGAEVSWAGEPFQPATLGTPHCGIGPIEATHRFGDDGVFEHEVCVQEAAWQAAGGAPACDRATVTVRNVAPTVVLTTDYDLTVGGPLEVVGTFTDPGLLDTHRAEIDWGDGAPEVVALDQQAGGGTVQASHPYSEAGTYLVRLCVFDDDGGRGCAELSVTVDAVSAEPDVSLGDLAIREAAGLAGVPVLLSETSSQPVTVHFATVDGSALAGQDYTPTAGSLTVPSGQAQSVIPVPVTADDVDELDEVFLVQVTSVDGGVLVDGEAQVTILDDDQALLSAADVEVEEGDTNSEARFEVRLSNPADRDVTVRYSTADDTALAGEDYTTTEGELTFAPTVTTQNVNVPILGDSLFEPAEETFRLELSEPTVAQLADAEALATILDDELCPGPELLPALGTQAWTQTDRVWTHTVDVRAYGGGTLGSSELRIAFALTLSLADGETARVQVEALDGGGLLLDAFDSGDVIGPVEALTLSETLDAITGVESVRVRVWAVPDQVAVLSLTSLRQPVIWATSEPVVEGDIGDTAELLFTVQLSCALTEPVVLAYETVDITATAGEDYLAATGSLVLEPGTTSTQVPVSVLGDDLDEGRETLQLGMQLVEPDLVLLLQLVIEGQILDDDACTRSPGYWKTHREDWPVDRLTLGGVEYGDVELMGFLQYGGPDAASKLAHHLVATKLNLANGTDPFILPIVEAADAFLQDFPPGSNPKGADRKRGNELKDQLDAYNNLHCDI